MPAFRKKTPQRRSNPKKVSRYNSHKENLQADFNSRCGYCDDHDKWKNTFYEIDHFVPKDYLKDINIADTDYQNLVYSCRSCNNAKRDKWPTKDGSIHHNGKEGFIDPCSSSYDEHFERNDDGEILYNTELGKWIHEKLKLYIKRHSIIWQLERLSLIIEQIIPLQNKNPSIKEKLLTLLLQYKELDDYIRNT